MINELEQIILGSLLGDGCIPKLSKKQKTHRLQILHGAKQELYCMHKYNLFKKFDLVNSLCYSESKDPRIIGEKSFSVKFRTKSNSIFCKYRNIFYPQGKKIVTKEAVKNLDALGLAIWFMDDGTKAKNTYIICTQGFDYDSVKVLSDLLWEKWNIETTINKRNELYVRVEGVATFTSLILPYIHPSMMYKVQDKPGELRENRGRSTRSQAKDASLEGSETTGGIGSLNNQLERPAPEMVMR